jgi:DNA polymerase III subunit beta
MKMNIQRESFSHLFHLAAVVAPQRSPKNIIQNVLIEAIGTEAVISATDMELSIRLTTNLVTILKPGAIVVPVQRFAGVLKEVVDTEISIEVVNNIAVITGASSRFELPLKSPDEFPTIELFDEKNYLEIPSRVFKEMIRRTAFAADTESTRYALSGILLELQSPELLTAVATDGRRLAKMDGIVKIVGDYNSQQTTIVPTRTMQLIERMLPEDETPILIGGDSNQLRVKSQNGVIHSRLVEGRYPRWKDAIPKDRNSLKLTMLAGTLHAALRQAAIVSDAETRGVDFRFSQGTLVVNSQAAEVGHARIEVPINYDGEVVETALDLRYLTEMLRVLPPDQLVDLDIEGPQTAAYLKTADSFGYVLMPLTRKNH